MIAAVAGVGDPGILGKRSKQYIRGHHPSYNNFDIITPLFFPCSKDTAGAIVVTASFVPFITKGFTAARLRACFFGGIMDDASHITTFYAHSRDNDPNPAHWQRLDEHLNNILDCGPNSKD